jgi:hypothetical protein
MKPESQNSPLIDNGSLTHVLWRCRFMETDLVQNALSKSTESTNNFHEYVQATNIFQGYALDYTRSRAEKIDSFTIRLSSRGFAVEEVTICLNVFLKCQNSAFRHSVSHKVLAQLSLVSTAHFCVG